MAPVFIAPINEKIPDVTTLNAANLLTAKADCLPNASISLVAPATALAVEVIDCDVLVILLLTLEIFPNLLIVLPKELREAFNV